MEAQEALWRVPGEALEGPGGPGFLGAPWISGPLQIVMAPTAKASDLGLIFEDFQALYLRGTQLEPTKSLCKLKTKVFEFGGPLNS